ncbi:Protein of unknown function [Meinhardsimonia xiamenensis]|jgi:hypothetical protein|uniref:Flagellar protein n=1 Tax=Meinhardsimonia xiamenensis TaxID=990712 RepID=A0A1G9EMK2_9RHOB|nr:DUF1217 domain-containing protein [Meinhardsimonia xiamenensis]PRX33705.1 uncharacterized protein DUF1217 [Meinhardsimonia xiamenensis]SDK77356.1 Protein of unknown function [Meinhardsimonia xiamenensis]
MSFRPALPLTGWAGWKFLERTRAAQQSAFDRSPGIQRETAYFEARIATVGSAAELVADPRLLRVALGAFGLDGDLPNRYFIRKVLEEGTLKPGALANRLADARYRDMARAFGFGDSDPPNTGLPGFGARIARQYRARQFEIAVGRQDEALRLALSADRELAEIARASTTDDGRWFLVMGRPPLRKVVETALGLPAGIGALDLDRQLADFRRAAQERLGDGEVATLADGSRRETLIRLFLARSAAQRTGLPAATPATAAAGVALSLLQMTAPARR